MPVHVPKTSKEAMNMVKRGWMFLLKKNPAIFVPLTFWILFGGFIFLYQYVDADKFIMKEAKPIGESVSFSIMPQAIAGNNNNPVVFNNKVWGYEDTTLIVKALKDRPVLLVYDKITQKVYEVEFYGRSFKMRK